MDRSRLSNIIATTRLLAHFLQQNVDSMKSCIFEQMECENECEFICKALNSLWKTMSVQETAIIKRRAIEISDEQPLTLAQSIETAKATIKRNCNHNNVITVYKHVHNQQNDALSRLHSNIIDYLGTFLTKQESIEFGYLSKQLGTLVL